MSTPGADLGDSLVDRVERAVLAVDGVQGLHAGVLGEVATYLPGRRVGGLRLRDGGCDEVLVVLGARADDARLLVPDGARVVVADDWSDGMAASLRAGLRALLAGSDADAALVTLVDLPDATGDVARRVRGAEPGPASLARATYGGRPGHPVLLGRDHWAAVAADLAERGDRVRSTAEVGADLAARIAG